MSELLLSILRIGFLIALWWFVLTVVSVLRRDLQAPRDAKPLTPARSSKRPSPRPTLRARKTSTQLVIVDQPMELGLIAPAYQLQPSFALALSFELVEPAWN